MDALVDCNTLKKKTKAREGYLIYSLGYCMFLGQMHSLVPHILFKNIDFMKNIFGHSVEYSYDCNTNRNNTEFRANFLKSGNSLAYHTRVH